MKPASRWNAKSAVIARRSRQRATLQYRRAKLKTLGGDDLSNAVLKAAREVVITPASANRVFPAVLGIARATERRAGQPSLKIRNVSGLRGIEINAM